MRGACLAFEASTIVHTEKKAPRVTTFMWLLCLFCWDVRDMMLGTGLMKYFIRDCLLLGTSICWG